MIREELTVDEVLHAKGTAILKCKDRYFKTGCMPSSFRTIHLKDYTITIDTINENTKYVSSSLPYMKVPVTLFEITEGEAIELLI